MIKTFRGLLADGGQDRIRLQTIKGKVGYRITKLELFPSAPGVTVQESVVKVFKEFQSSITGTVNFTDSGMLAASYQRSPASVGTASGYSTTIFTIFDDEIFNQDIYITHDDNATGITCNYYLELEVIPLDDAGAEYTTLKDMRQS